MVERIHREGWEERETKNMLSTPISALSRYIGSKWFLTLEQLSEQSGLSLHTIHKAVNGERISPAYERRLRAFLDKL